MLVEGDWDAALFSHHTLRTCHNGEMRKVRVTIEPLVGLLRHPKYYCIVPASASLAPPALTNPCFHGGTHWKHNRDYLLAVLGQRDAANAWPPLALLLCTCRSLFCHLLLNVEVFI